MSADRCHHCPAASASRRAFLRDAGLAAAGALALSVAWGPGAALAESVSRIRPSAGTGARRTYEIPRGDSVSIDDANDVIIARWQNRVYAFSVKCPHRGTRLEWRSGEQRMFCPKHKARFTPDGAHDSGRTSRPLDRYPISRQGTLLTVDLDAVLRADVDLPAWKAAVIGLP